MPPVPLEPLPDHYMQLPETKESAFAGISREQLAVHIERSRYGDFELTDAIRPAPDLRNIPRRGYIIDSRQAQNEHPASFYVGISETRSNLLPLLLDLLDTMPQFVDCFLQRTQNVNGQIGVSRYVRELIGRSALQDLIRKFHDILLNDGYIGLWVCHPTQPVHLSFDDHKIIAIVSQERSMYYAFLRTLRQNGLPLDEDLVMIAQTEHVHMSYSSSAAEVEQLKRALRTSDEPD